MKIQSKTVKNSLVFGSFFCLVGILGYLMLHFTGQLVTGDSIFGRGISYFYTGWRGLSSGLMALAIVSGSTLMLIETWKLLRNPETRGKTVLWIFALIGFFQVLAWIFK